MKFAGELKFPDIDHPGVPVQFVIEGAQAELVVEDESLGRWSLYDVHARRLIASAFEIDLDGTEVTFVADDPIDFAYRGVEHMAQTWASMKSKRIATRTVAVRKSRRGAKPSRIEDLRAAMESNLDEQAPRPLAGEPSMPERASAEPERASAEPERASAEPERASAEPERAGADSVAAEPAAASDWDQRDPTGAIPLVGESRQASHPEPVKEASDSEHVVVAKSEEELSLEAEKRALAEERARLEDERRAAEQREANLIEAYRLEVKRLEAEREELRREAAEAAERSAAERVAAEQAAKEAAERSAAQEKARAEREAAARAEMEREAAEREERERQAREREAAVQAELERRIAERKARERQAAEREAAEREAAEREAAEREAAEQEAAQQEAAQQEAAQQEAAASARQEAAARAAKQAEEEESEEEAAPSTSQAFDASAFRREVVDLDDLDGERGSEPASPPSPTPVPGPQSEPALAGAPKEKGGGLMGAVKAAFRGGAKDHEHQFVEAPGGIGITRYVCEECGYVSISV